MRLAAPLWSDLTATPYREHGRTPGEGLDCWGLAAEVFRRAGVELPAAPDETVGWRRLARAEIGCLVLMRHEGRRHVGVFLGDDGLLHATRVAGVAVTPLSAAQAAGLVLGFYWPDGAAVPVQERTEAPTDVMATYVDLVTGERRTERRAWPWEPEVPRFGRVLAGTAVPGGHVVIGVGPGDPVSTGIGLALTLASFILQRAFAPSVPKEKPEIPSPSFDLSSYLANTAAVGGAQHVGYGECRTGGQILSAFQRADEQGRSVLYLLLMVSRGPIHSIGGLAADVDGLTGAAIPASITIDGNPASQYSCSVSLRMGNADQDPIPGFRETVNATSYAYTLQVGAPFAHVGTQRAQSLEAVFSFPLGLYNLSSSGAVGPRTVTFTIRYRIVSTTTWTTQTFVVTNARRGGFQRTWRVDGLAKGKYEIQFERIAPPWPETAQDHESRSDLIEVHEITADELVYPGKALIGIRAIGTDQLSGGVPQINSVGKWRKVWVWDGISTTAPTFGAAEIWTKNPAWITLDALINPHYGMGRGGRLTLDNIDLGSFLVWANLCDTLVSDGRGGMVARAECSFMADEVTGGWELANAVANSHFARLCMIGRKVRVVAEDAATPVYPISMGNCRDVAMGYVGRLRRPNAVEVAYINSETNYEADVAPKFDENAIVVSGEPVVKETVQAVGVTRACQAYRLAQLRLNYATLSKRRLEFTGGPETLHLLPGEVIWFSHDALNAGISGRLLGATATTVRLDAAIDASGGSFNVMVRTKGTGADVIQTASISVPAAYARGDTIVVSGLSGADVPVAGDVYACGAFNSYRAKFRIVSIETTQELARRFQCVEYVDGIHSDDPGDVESFTDVMPDPRATPAAVANLSARQIEIVGTDGSTPDAILVEWDPDEAWHSADVWFRSTFDGDSGTGRIWLYAGRSAYGRLQIDSAPAGASVTVSVVPVAARGTRQTPDQGTQATVFVRGRRTPPGNPQGLTGNVVGGMLSVCITPPEDLTGVVGYEVRCGTTWAGARVLGRRVPSEWTTPCPFVGTFPILARSVSVHGVVSIGQVSADVESIVQSAVYGFDSESDETGAWTGTKTDTTVDGANLGLDTGDLTGTYVSRHPVGAAASTMRVFTNLMTGLKDVALIASDCAFRANDPRWDGVTADVAVLTGNEASEGLRADECGFACDALPGSIMQAAGPIDVFAALEPELQLLDDADYFDGCAYEKTLQGDVYGVLTLNRPHSRYQPQASVMRTAAYTFAG